MQTVQKYWIMDKKTSNLNILLNSLKIYAFPFYLAFLYIRKTKFSILAEAFVFLLQFLFLLENKQGHLG